MASPGWSLHHFARVRRAALRPAEARDGSRRRLGQVRRLQHVRPSMAACRQCDAPSGLQPVTRRRSCLAHDGRATQHVHAMAEQRAVARCRRDLHPTAWCGTPRRVIARSDFVKIARVPRDPASVCSIRPAQAVANVVQGGCPATSVQGRSNSLRPSMVTGGAPCISGRWTA